MMIYWKNIVLFGNKVSPDTKKEFVSESVYIKKVLKTKIRSYGG